MTTSWLTDTRDQATKDLCWLWRGRFHLCLQLAVVQAVVYRVPVRRKRRTPEAKSTSACSYEPELLPRPKWAGR
jgi:hypothetical protein